MSGLAERAEQIAAHLVEQATGAEVVAHDVDGRQGAVDFLLHWQDGTAGALEVTLLTDKKSMGWQGQAMNDGWRWPAVTPWEFRSAEASFPYKKTKSAAIKAVELCDTWGVDNPRNLPGEVLGAHPELSSLFNADGVGLLRRTPFSPGIEIFQNTVAEFVEATHPDFSRFVASWHDVPHIGLHLAKVLRAPDVSSRHLFVVVVSEKLPHRFFDHNFDSPQYPPPGFEGLDGLWVWSEFWHRTLVFRHDTWSWFDFSKEA